MEKQQKKKLRTDMELRKSVGQRMRRAREEAGVSAEHTAKKLGVSDTMVNLWEVGRSFPSVEHLMDLLRLYQINADWLLENLPQGMDDEDEVRLLTCYRRLEPKYRRALLATAQAMLGSGDDSAEPVELTS